MWKMFKVPKIVRRAHELDPTPMAIPLKFKRDISLEEKVAQMIRSEQFAAGMKQLGKESLEEAYDFGDDDDDDDAPSSDYEFEGKNYNRQLDTFMRTELRKRRLASKAKPEGTAPASPEAVAAPPSGDPLKKEGTVPTT